MPHNEDDEEDSMSSLIDHSSLKRRNDKLLATQAEFENHGGHFANAASPGQPRAAGKDTIMAPEFITMMKDGEYSGQFN